MEDIIWWAKRLTALVAIGFTASLLPILIVWIAWAITRSGVLA